MAKPINPASEAKRLHRQSKRGVVVATVQDDGEDGAYVQLGFDAISLVNAEFVVIELLQAMRENMAADFHDCDACRSRLARIIDALRVLERDGASRIGEVHGSVQ